LYESTGFHGQKYAENCGSEALKLWISEKIAIAELWLCSNISLKVAELRLRKCFLQVAELRLWTQKKVARAHLCLSVPNIFSRFRINQNLFFTFSSWLKGIVQRILRGDNNKLK
jgi:hypothetical protein